MRNRSLWFVAGFAAAFATQSPTRAQDNGGDSDGENRGTLEQQLACTPDVFRLCGSQIPDANRIVACLRQNTDQLDASCKAVFEAKDDNSQGDAVRTRRASHSGGQQR